MVYRSRVVVGYPFTSKLPLLAVLLWNTQAEVSPQIEAWLIKAKFPAVNLAYKILAELWRPPLGYHSQTTGRVDSVG